MLLRSPNSAQEQSLIPAADLRSENALAVAQVAIERRLVSGLGMIDR
jgi:hypothetical protein